MYILYFVGIVLQEISYVLLAAVEIFYSLFTVFGKTKPLLTSEQGP